MFATLWLTFAANFPHVGPNTGNPLSPVLVKLGDVILGVLALLMVVLFFVGLAKAAASLLSSREGGAGSGIALAVASLIVLAIIYAGSTYLNKWTSFLGI